MLHAGHGMARSAITSSVLRTRDTSRPAGAVLRVDARGVIRQADARACVMLGHPRGALHGRALGDVLVKDARTVRARRREGGDLAVEVSRLPLGGRQADEAVTEVVLRPAPGAAALAAAAAAAVRREDALVALLDAALAGHEPRELARAGVRAVADGLDAGGAALLELSPDGALALLAQTGGRRSRAPGEPTARLAFALEDTAPVLDDPAPTLGATVAPTGDGIVAVVRSHGAAFGLLCAHNAGHRTFGAGDRSFLGNAADLLGAALDAHGVQPAPRTATGG
jgi:hypothetical protein